MTPYCHTTLRPRAHSRVAVQCPLFGLRFFPESSPKQRCSISLPLLCVARPSPCLCSRDLGPTRVVAFIFVATRHFHPRLLGTTEGSRSQFCCGRRVCSRSRIPEKRFAKKGLNFACGPRQVWPRSIINRCVAAWFLQRLLLDLRSRSLTSGGLKCGVQQWLMFFLALYFEHFLP